MILLDQCIASPKIFKIVPMVIPWFSRCKNFLKVNILVMNDELPDRPGERLDKGLCLQQVDNPIDSISPSSVSPLETPGLFEVGILRNVGREVT
jgi:hypothetical protein